jgi:hypothetical protein
MGDSIFTEEQKKEIRRIIRLETLVELPREMAGNQSPGVPIAEAVHVLIDWLLPKDRRVSPQSKDWD